MSFSGAKHRATGWAPPVFLFLAVLLAYAPSLRGGFLWNDSDYVTAPALRSWSGLGRIWLQPGATQQYYPLLHTAFWAEHRLWGDDPLGYRLVNVAFHAAAACLLAGVARALGAPRPAAWLGAGLFALHPVGVESVAWITEQKNTLSGVFYLAAAWAYLRWSAARARPAAGYFAATALFAAALLCKTTTVVLPAVLLIAAWWRRGRLDGRRDLLPLAPWFLLGLAAGLFSSWVERRYVGAQGLDFSLGAAQRVLVAGRAVWFYLGKLLWPAPLVFVYPKWLPDARDGFEWLAPAAVALAAWAGWAWRPRSRAPLALFLAFVASLFPVLGFFAFYGSLYSFVADHWQYLAALPVLGAAGAGLARAARGGAGAKIACLALPAVLGVLTWRQCRIYRDSKALYRATLAGNPSCWMASTNLGDELLHDGQVEEAIGYFRSALQVRDSAVIRNSLGVALRAAGRPEEGLPEFSAALRLEPGYAEAGANLADVLAGLGRTAEAESRYEAVLRLHPDYAPAHNNLANLLFQRGRPSEALAHYRAALAIDPGYAEAHMNLANVLLAEGGVEQAIAEYRAALRLRPDFPEARANLAAALERAGRP